MISLNSNVYMNALINLFYWYYQTKYPNNISKSNSYLIEIKARNTMKTCIVIGPFRMMHYFQSDIFHFKTNLNLYCCKLRFCLCTAICVEQTVSYLLQHCSKCYKVKSHRTTESVSTPIRYSDKRSSDKNKLQKPLNRIDSVCNVI